MMTSKSLSEQVNEVLNGKGTKAYKQVCLEGLGLTKGDVKNLMYLYTMQERANQPERAPRAPRTPSIATLVKKLTFGVEIECVGATRVKLVRNATAQGITMRPEGYNHTDNRTYFKIVSDSSVTGDNPNEVVSPILDGNSNGFNSLQACCIALQNAGAHPNRSTGLHVHVGYQNMTDEHYINVFKNYQKLQYLINTFMPLSRRDGQWAYSMSRYNFEGCTTKQDVRYRIRTRYAAVNPESYDRHRTIEFRQHGGSVNYEKISMWVNFCLKLVVWSKDNVLTEEVTSIKNVPFLTKKEKDFFKARIEHFASVA